MSAPTHAARHLAWCEMQVRQRRRLLTRTPAGASPARLAAAQRQLADAQAVLSIVRAAVVPAASAPLKEPA